MGEIITYSAFLIMVASGLAFFYISYAEEREHHKAMRRLARQKNRNLRDTTRAIEEACLESLRRDGYLVRR